MRCLAVLGIVVGVIFGAGKTCFAVQESTPSAEELERKALDYRREFFRRGRVVLLSETRGKVLQQVDFEYEITFDENQIRFDRKGRLLGKQKWGSPQKYVISGNIYIDNDARDDPVLVVDVGRRNEYDDIMKHFGVFHPRALGMSVVGTAGMVRSGIEEFLGRADREAPKVTGERLGDLDTWRIEYRLNRGADVSIWIAPSKGYGVVRAEERIDSPRGLVIQSVVSELAQYGKDNIWYPRRSEQELSLNGVWQDRQVITVKEANFGGVVDETVFTLAGMDIEPGRVISDTSQEDPMAYVWDGEKTVPLGSADDGSTGVLADGTWSPFRSWLLLANSIILAVLACFVVVRMLRGRGA